MEDEETTLVSKHVLVIRQRPGLQVKARDANCYLARPCYSLYCWDCDNTIEASD